MSDETALLAAIWEHPHDDIRLRFWGGFTDDEADSRPAQYLPD